MAKKDRLEEVTGSSWAGETVDISAADHTFAAKKIVGLYVGAAGTVVCRLAGDDADLTFVGVQAGSILPIQPTIIRKTSTTAGSMIGLL